MSKKIPLVEMFGPTIQGEGAVIGQQTYFMRFGLCDYKCTMCDSMNAVDPAQVRANARFMTQEEIVSEFLTKTYQPGSTKWVTLSGGNPCIHDLSEVVDALRAEGFKVNVETQGTFAPKWVTDCNMVTVSPKGPGMGETTSINNLDKFMKNTLDIHGDMYFKIVVFDQRDLEFAKMLWERYQKEYGIPFYLSLGNPNPPGYDLNGDALPPTPEHSHTNPEHIERLVTRYRRIFDEIKLDPILSSMRFLPQWHVFVWGNERGR